MITSFKAHQLFMIRKYVISCTFESKYRILYIASGRYLRTQRYTLAIYESTFVGQILVQLKGSNKELTPSIRKPGLISSKVCSCPCKTQPEYRQYAAPQSGPLPPLQTIAQPSPKPPMLPFESPAVGPTTNEHRERVAGDPLREVRSDAKPFVPALSASRYIQTALTSAPSTYIDSQGLSRCVTPCRSTGENSHRRASRYGSKQSPCKRSHLLLLF